MNFIITLTVVLSLLVSGCQYLQQPQGTPVLNESQPIVLNETNVTNSTVEVVNPLFDYGSPRYGNLTFYFPSGLKGNSVIVFGSKNETILLDAGDAEDFEVVAKTLRNLGVEQIDAVVLSRNVGSTSGSLQVLSSMFTIKKVYHNGLAAYKEPLLSLDSVLEEEAVTFDTAAQVGTVQLQFFVPYDDSNGFSENEDENSIITKVTFGRRSLLYAAGCGLLCEGRIASSNLRSGVLVTALNGGCSGSTTYFLKFASPVSAVSFGTPCSDVSSRLEELGISNINTIKDGDVALSTNGFNPFIAGGRK